MFDCKLCGEWSLTSYICDDCYLIKNSIRLYGKEEIINLVKNKYNIEDKKKIIDDNVNIIKQEEEDEKINPKKRPRFNSENLYNNKNNDDKYIYKEINDDVLDELKEKLTKL
tara:strand:- start:838 stop:1173 length:336 start_codon:yes stop_codon:yes gene_type:complete